MQVLLIVANGLQLGYLGCYGNEWVLTPTLDRLAAEGIVFDRHYADCPDHVRALASCRTGLYQIPLAGNEPPSPDRMHPGHDLIEILTQAGVATSLVLEKKNRAYQEFARFRQTVGPVVPEGNTEARSLDRAFASAANCLKKLAAKKNSLAWLDLTTLLPEWEFPDEYRTFYCREEAGDDQ